MTVFAFIVGFILGLVTGFYTIGFALIMAEEEDGGTQNVRKNNHRQ